MITKVKNKCALAFSHCLPFHTYPSRINTFFANRRVSGLLGEWMKVRNENRSFGKTVLLERDDDGNGTTADRFLGNGS
jgi:hypothetical protein